MQSRRFEISPVWKAFSKKVFNERGKLIKSQICFLTLFLGIDPSVGTHKNYLDQLCEDFENKLKDMITESITEHKTAETDNVLYAEVVQHTLFCKKKIEVVYGREPTLEVLS